MTHNSRPNPRARSRTARPMAPRPITPKLRPQSPRATEYRFLFQQPARRSITLSGILRSIAMRRPITNSATAAALRPGTLQTRISRSAAACLSMVLVPAPARIIRHSLVAASTVARVTGVLRTTRISAVPLAPGKVSPLRSGFRSHS